MVALVDCGAVSVRRHRQKLHGFYSSRGRLRACHVPCSRSCPSLGKPPARTGPAVPTAPQTTLASRLQSCYPCNVRHISPKKRAPGCKPRRALGLSAPRRPLQFLPHPHVGAALVEVRLSAHRVALLLVEPTCALLGAELAARAAACHRALLGGPKNARP